MPVPQAASLLIDNFQAVLLPHVWNIVITLSPIFLAVILCVIMWDLWVDYIRVKFFLSLKYTVLELRLPKETNKSPAAMETVLHSIHNAADGSFYAQFWKGEVRPWYSLELVSLGGQVKYMLWTEDRRKVSLMGVLYAQFPGIEIIEREDYTKSVHFDPKTMRIWAAEFIFLKKDPYPIRTYIDYGLDKDPKEEFRVDPLVPILEFLGNVPANAQIWFQLIIRAHKKEQKDPKKMFRIFKTDLWKDQAEEIKNEIMVRKDVKNKIAGIVNEQGFAISPTLSPLETDTVKAIDRKLSKLPFDVGIRALYICPKTSFDGPFGIGGCISSFKQFNSEAWNGFRPGSNWHGGDNGFPWEDYMNIRRDRMAKQALMAYKRRSFFYYPFETKPLVLNTEELATVYHFPGSVAATPGLQRVPSKKSEAPANLPT